MQERFLHTVSGRDEYNRPRAVVAFDYDAMLALDGQGATHGRHMDFSYSRDALRPMLAGGWTEGAAQATALSSVLAGEIPAVASIRRRWEYGPEGEELSAERALAGDWDVAYRRNVKRRTAGHVIVTLGAQFGGRSHRTANELFWTGAQLIAAADVLEAAGYRVEAHALNLCRYHNASGRGKRNQIGVLDLVAKRPEDVLRPDVLMAACAHADVYRSFGFTAKCYLPREFSVGDMGATMDGDPQEQRDTLQAFTDAGMLPQIDNFMPHAYNRETAVRNVLAVLHAVTGEPVE